MPQNNYNSLRDKTLALFFTFNVSLKTWHDVGMINREVALYNKLSHYFKHIYFFTYGGKEDLKLKNYLSENITIVPIPFVNMPNSSKVFLLLMLVYSFLLPIIHYKIFKNVDILKTNQMNGSWAAVMAKILFRKKLVVRTGYTWSLFAERNILNSWKKKVVKVIERFSYSFADGAIVSSNRDLEYLTSNYWLNGYQIVIPNYVDTEVFKPLNVQKKKGSICFVGRLEEQKNLFSLLKAMVGLPYVLTVVGSGPLRENLEKYAKEKEINAEFLGNLPSPKVPELLNQHEIFVLPSLYEGMPKALLEAMACGLPVVGTDVEGIREVIAHEKNGVLCKTDSYSIRETIVRLMDDEKLKKNIGIEARTMARRQFSLSSSVEKELCLYKKLSREGPDSYENFIGKVIR